MESIHETGSGNIAFPLYSTTLYYTLLHYYTVLYHYTELSYIGLCFGSG